MKENKKQIVTLQVVLALLFIGLAIFFKSEVRAAEDSLSSSASQEINLASEDDREDDEDSVHAFSDDDLDASDSLQPDGTGIDELNSTSLMEESPEGEVVATGECGLEVTWTLYNTGKLYIYGAGPMTGGAWRNEDCPITEVLIEGPVTSIPEETFRNLKDLRVCTMPNTVERIGSDAFEYCSNLSRIILSDSLVEIGPHAFSWCSSLSEIDLPDGIKNIPWGTFEYCSSLKRIVLPNSIETLGKWAFYDCYSLTEIVLPANLEIIEESTFSGCESLKSIVLPRSIKTIKYDAFFHCYNLESISIPNSLQSVGLSAFNSCWKLDYVHFGGTKEEWESVSIYDTYDEGNAWLTSAYITYNDYIDDNDRLERTEKKVILAKVCSFGPGTVFKYEDDGTLTVQGKGGICSISGLLEPPEDYLLKRIKIRIGTSSLSGSLERSYSQYDQNTNIDIILPDTLEYIGSNVFYAAPIKSITFPENLKEIDDSAFENCKYLESVELPSNMNRLGMRVFAGCTSLETVKMPDYITGGVGGEIAQYPDVDLVSLFQGCTSLKNVNLPKNTSSLYWTFEGCTSLTNIQIPEGVKSIEGAFQDCPNLDFDHLIFPDNMEMLCWGTDDNDENEKENENEKIKNLCIGGADEIFGFKGCPSLSKVVINGNVRTMGGAFRDCNALTSVTITGNVGTMSGAFQGCTALSDIRISGTVEDMEGAFSGCESLSEASVENILAAKKNHIVDASLFEWCSNIKSISIPDGMTTIEEKAFGECAALSTVYFPASIEIIDNSAFVNCKKLTDIYYEGSEEAWKNVNVGETGNSWFDAAKKHFANSKFLVTFVNAGVKISKRIITNGAKISKPEAPFRMGYVFAGWFTDVAFTNPWNFEQDVVTSDIILHAKWKKQVTISFNSNGGTSVSSVTVAEGDKLTRPESAKQYYTLSGWYKDKDLTIPWDFDNDTVTEAITLYAKWVRNEHTVTFDSNGGSSIVPVSVAEGEVIKKPENPSRAKYTFTGWYLDRDLSTQWNFYTNKVSTDITLYAGWSLNTYKVTFANAQGIPAQNVEEGEKVVVPETPVRANYVFAGWYKNSSCTVEWNFETDTVQSNVSIYAKWIALYKVYFNYENGEEQTYQEVQYMSLVTKPEDPVRLGYSFLGWYTSSSGGTLWDFNSKQVTANVNLYARWAEKYYTVSYVTNGGNTDVINRSVQEGKKATRLSVTRTGYTFVGWYRDEVLFDEYDFSDPVLDDITLYAKWKINVYTVSFNTNGFGTIDDQSIEYGQHASCPEMTREGYDFGGWYRNSSMTTKWDFATDTVISDMTLYAKWTIKRYKVIYQTNGGTNSGHQMINHGSKTSAVLTKKTGYTLEGWYTDEALTERWDFNTPIVQEVVLYAKWTINTYSIAFDSIGGSEVQSQTLNYGELVNRPADPVKENYVFVGWYTNTDYTAPWDFEYYTVSLNRTLYAKWALQAYIVSFDSNGGSAVNSQRVEHGGKALKPGNPTKSGYSLAGWYTDKELTDEWNFEQDSVTQDMTLYGKWEVSRYTVSFNSKGGSVVPEQNIQYGGKVTRPADPIKTGYTFVDWCVDWIQSRTWDFTSNTITENRTLYAEWRKNRYTLSFASNGGSSVAGKWVWYGDKISVPATPIREGYVFAGWYKDSALTSVWNFNSDTISGDTTLYAKWTVNVYTVSFSSNGGNAVSGQRIEYGAKVVKPADPARENYVFTGWYADAGLTRPWDFAKDTVSADITLYAGWRLSSHTISFVGAGENVTKTAEVEHGSPVAAVGTDAWTGHVFIGWYADQALTREYNFARPVTADITIYAKWEKGGEIGNISWRLDENGLLTLNGRGEIPAMNPGQAWLSFASEIVSVRLNEGITSIGDKAFYDCFNLREVSIPRSVTGIGEYAFWSCESLTAISLPENLETIGAYAFSYCSLSNITLPAKISTIREHTFGGCHYLREITLPAGLKTIEDNVFGGIPLSKVYFRGSNQDWSKINIGTGNWVLENAEVQCDISSWTVSFILDEFNTSYRYIVDGMSVEEPVMPVKEGYTFLGWYSDEAMTSTFSFNTPITSDLTLYAKWQANEYTITFNSAEGSAVAPITAEYGTLITKPADPEKEGHTFLGWYTDEALTDLWEFAHDTVSGDMTLFAKWQAGEYTVTFEAWKGTPVLPAAAEYGKTIPMPEPPTREGYIFDGWYSDEALTTRWDFEQDTVSGDITLYAFWKPITYTVRYDANRPADAEESVLGNTESSTHTFDQEEPLTPNGFTLEGYTFAGWNEKPDGTGRAWIEGDRVKNLSAEEGAVVILYAQWREDAAVTYIVSFNTDTPSQLVEEGKYVVRPADPVREGYVFAGWYKDNKLTAAYDFDTPVTGNLYLYAKWEHEKNGVTVSDPFSVSFLHVASDSYEGIVQKGNSFSIAYTGSAITPEIGVFGPDGRALVKEADYTVRFSNNLNANKDKKASVQITGKGVFNGKKTLEFTILPVDLQESADRGLLEVNISAQSGKKAAASLVYRGIQLKTKDYVLSNISPVSAAGKKTNITGQGSNFTGLLKEQEITLLTAADSKRLKLKAQIKANKVYNGSPQTLNSAKGELTVKNGNGAVLKEGTDYEVTYFGNTDAGTVRVSIRGLNDYALSDGTVASFKINPDKTGKINAGRIGEEVYYDPAGACPAIEVNLLRDGKDIALQEGKDYKVSYSANKKVGMGKYTVSFLGNYKGHPAVKGSFLIQRRPIEDATLITPDMVYYKPGKYLGAAFVGLDGVLLKKTDYVLKYNDDQSDKTVSEKDKLTLSAGEKDRYYSVGLGAKQGGNYTGEGSTVDDIRLVKESEVEADLCKAKVTVSNAAYTGEEVKPKVSVSIKKNGSWVTLASTKYHVAYFNNINKGKGTVLVYGKEDTGTAGYKTATFTISAKNISEFAAK